MPMDFDLGRGAVSGLKRGIGKGKIAGSPEGSLDQIPPKYPWKEVPFPGTGQIRGTPVGIKGEVRRMTSPGRMAAIKRAIG